MFTSILCFALLFFFVGFIVFCTCLGQLLVLENDRLKHLCSTPICGILIKRNSYSLPPQILTSLFLTLYEKLSHLSLSLSHITLFLLRPFPPPRCRRQTLPLSTLFFSDRRSHILDLKEKECKSTTKKTQICRSEQRHRWGCKTAAAMVVVRYEMRQHETIVVVKNEGDTTCEVSVFGAGCDRGLKVWVKYGVSWFPPLFSVRGRTNSERG